MPMSIATTTAIANTTTTTTTTALSSATANSSRPSFTVPVNTPLSSTAPVFEKNFCKTPHSVNPQSSSDIPSDPDDQFFDDNDTTAIIQPNDAAFLTKSNRLTRDYVSSHVTNAAELLHTANARSAFVTAVFGDTSLSKLAYTDPPFLRQLETRASLLAIHTIPIVSNDTNFAQVDATIAILALVAARWPILISVLERHGVILCVVTAMKRWAHTPVVVARCMTALRVLAVTDSVRKQIMVHGGLNLTLQLMQRYITDHRVQLRAPAVIANVAFGCTHRKRRIARQGGLRHIIRGMNTFPLDEDIQLRGALTIRNLTHQAQVNQYIAGNEGAVQAVSAALIRFRATSTRPELRFHCVMALESLCREDERNRQRIVDIETGHVYQHNYHTIHPSMTLTRSSDEDHATNKRVNEDGDIVVDEEEILLAHTTADYRHGQALIPGRAPNRADTFTSMASTAGSDHKSTPSRSPQPDESTPNSPTDEKKVSLIRTIIHSIRRDPDDELLVETALSLLTFVSMHRPEIQQKIGHLGGIHVAIAAMRRHSSSSAVIAKACALIRGLCFEQSNRSFATSGLVVMVEATRDHRRDAETSREIVSALSNTVFEHEKNRTLVVSKGGIEAVVAVMDECGDVDAMALEACICALRNFVVTNETGALCASKKKVIHAVVGALKRTKDDTYESLDLVREQCLLLLIDLARLAPRAKDEMLDIKAAPWIKNAVSRLDAKRFAEVHVETEKLLRTLDETDRKRKISDARMGHRMSPPAASNIIGRPTPRGLFSALSLGRRHKPGRGSTNRTTAEGKFEFPRISGVSTADGSQPGGRRYTRLSARFWRSAVVS